MKLEMTPVDRIAEMWLQSTDPTIDSEGIKRIVTFLAGGTLPLGHALIVTKDNFDVAVKLFVALNVTTRNKDGILPCSKGPVYYMASVLADAGITSEISFYEAQYANSQNRSLSMRQFVDTHLVKYKNILYLPATEGIEGREPNQEAAERAYNPLKRKEPDNVESNA